MANHPNRGRIDELLAVLRAQRIDAGTRRDGCAEAHLTPVLAVLTELYRGCGDLSSPRARRIAAERDEAMRLMPFCRVHDRHARGDLSASGYAQALVIQQSVAALATSER